MNLIFVGLGGAFGSLARYQLGKIVSQRSSSVYPLGTFIINISGAILLGVLTGLHTENNVYLLLGDGFLGAYTTFSTFMYDGYNLFHENEKKNAFTYILLTLLLGVVGYIVGYELSNAITGIR